MSERGAYRTAYLCHACGFFAAEETHDLTCWRCGEPRSETEEVVAVLLRSDDEGRLSRIPKYPSGE